MIATTQAPRTIAAAIEGQIFSRIHGQDVHKDIWGGVSIACIDWHPLEENLLAATTLKTNRLEIWRVDQGAMICIMDLKGKTA